MRFDISALNLSFRVLSSHYLPAHDGGAEPWPCVVVLHGNSGSRVEANALTLALLPARVSVFVFDFAGCGLSGGDFVSLGAHEVRGCFRRRRQPHTAPLHLSARTPARPLPRLLLAMRFHPNRSTTWRPLWLTCAPRLGGWQASACGEGAWAPSAPSSLPRGTRASQGSSWTRSALSTNQIYIFSARLLTTSFFSVRRLRLASFPSLSSLPKISFPHSHPAKPFSRLETLINELVAHHAPSLPSFAGSMAVGLLRRAIKSRAGFDICDVDPLKLAPSCFVPALFAHADNDCLIPPRHTAELASAYGGDCRRVLLSGDHNSPRPRFFVDSATIFLHNALRPLSPLAAAPFEGAAPPPMSPVAAEGRSLQWPSSGSGRLLDFLSSSDAGAGSGGDRGSGGEASSIDAAEQALIAQAVALSLAGDAAAQQSSERGASAPPDDWGCGLSEAELRSLLAALREEEEQGAGGAIDGSSGREAARSDGDPALPAPATAADPPRLSSAVQADPGGGALSAHRDDADKRFEEDLAQAIALSLNSGQ